MVLSYRLASSRFGILSALTLAGTAVGASAQSLLWSADGLSSGERYGLVVSRVGDINGDGIADVATGAPNNDLGGSDAGAVFVLSGADGSTLMTITGAAAGDSLGFSAAGAGDVDGDGTPDIIAGARFNDTAGPNYGQAIVVSGATGLVIHAFDGLTPNGRFGEAVNAAGDVNADGFADVIVGARLDSFGGPASGRARVFSGFDGALLFDIAGDGASDFFGRSVGAAGDVNADGHDDFLVGAPGDDDGGSSSGRVTVFSGLDGSVLYALDGDFPGDLLGGKVSGLGDLDGDGFDDFIAGMISSDFAGADRGAARIYSGFDGSAMFTVAGTEAGSEFGSAVGDAGDVNGDGWLDFIVGSRLDPIMGLPAGSATVFSGFDASIIQRYESTESGDQFGDTAVGMGDANGDGFDDLFIGAFGFDGAAFDGGRVLAYSGFDTLGETICGPAVLNSTGAPARILATGSLVAFDNDVTLSVVNLPLNSNGFFITSLDEFTVVGPGGSVGNICIASTVIGRYAGNILNSGTSGAVSLGLDLTSVPQPASITTVVAGDTRYWQYWFRDIPTSNFSDAVKITFL
ncbi:FG-GAP repeat protein [Planctomycetes bacterium Poly30]|uniref:FG-GAP repeat protein n=1 Tax=Saltatorellus ferox TaxID=2528018 RepID=A0A518EWR4_9BACT|nr:FG-GAP repeat protein [Planctomycetes bacterium Poly30]